MSQLHNLNNIEQVTDKTFDKVVNESTIPVVVDFWASWCGPCKMVAPLLDDLAEEFKDQVKIVKYDTEENQEIARAFNIQSIPTLLLFKDGEVADVKIGAAPYPVLKKWIKKAAVDKKSFFSRLFTS
jgi:thioredoxin 1